MKINPLLQLFCTGVASVLRMGCTVLYPYLMIIHLYFPVITASLYFVVVHCSPPVIFCTKCCLLDLGVLHLFLTVLQFVF